MGLIQWARGFREQRRLEATAEAISIQVWPEVRRQIDASVTRLPMHEARGYLRARAAIVVHPAVTSLVSREPALADLDSRQLIEAALEKTVNHALRQLSPSPVTPVRRAA